MNIVAFDIDGTLTEQPVLDLYKELNSTQGFTVGVVTRRPPTLSQKFIEDNELDTEFVRNRWFKSIAFNNIEQEIQAGRYIYIGNRITDYSYARFSGWEYIQSTTVNSDTANQLTE